MVSGRTSGRMHRPPISSTGSITPSQLRSAVKERTTICRSAPDQCSTTTASSMPFTQRVAWTKPAAGASICVARQAPMASPSRRTRRIRSPRPAGGMTPTTSATPRCSTTSVQASFTCSLPRVCTRRRWQTTRAASRTSYRLISPGGSCSRRFSLACPVALDTISRRSAATISIGTAGIISCSAIRHMRRPTGCRENRAGPGLFPMLATFHIRALVPTTFGLIVKICTWFRADGLSAHYGEADAPALPWLATAVQTPAARGA